MSKLWPSRLSRAPLHGIFNWFASAARTLRTDQAPAPTTSTAATSAATRCRRSQRLARGAEGSGPAARGSPAMPCAPLPLILRHLTHHARPRWIRWRVLPRQRTGRRKPRSTPAVRWWTAQSRQTCRCAPGRIRTCDTPALRGRPTHRSWLSQGHLVDDRPRLNGTSGIFEDQFVPMAVPMLWPRCRLNRPGRFPSGCVGCKGSQKTDP
jgi:hypothetical protein